MSLAAYFNKNHSSSIFNICIRNVRFYLFFFIVENIKKNKKKICFILCCMCFFLLIFDIKFKEFFFYIGVREFVLAYNGDVVEMARFNFNGVFLNENARVTLSRWRA